MPTVTLAQLQAYVYDRVENNSFLYTAQEVTNALNEFIRIANCFIGLNQSTVFVPGFSVANKLIYPIPSPILIPFQVSFDGRVLRKLSPAALARNYPRFATDNTAKSGPVSRWAPVGISQFLLHPADSIGGRAISVTGVIEPQLLGSAGDTIALEDEYIDMAVEYAGHRIQLKEGGKTFADASMSLQTFWKIMKERSRYRGLTFPRYWVLTGPTQ